MSCVQLEKEFSDMIARNPQKTRIEKAHLYNIDFLMDRRTMGNGDSDRTRNPPFNFNLDPEYVYSDWPRNRSDYEEAFLFTSGFGKILSDMEIHSLEKLKSNSSPETKEMKDIVIKHGDVIDCYLNKYRKTIAKRIAEWSARPGNPGYRVIARNNPAMLGGRRRTTRRSRRRRSKSMRSS